MPEEKEQCIFCLIGEKKVPSSILWDDSQIIAFLEIKPLTPGHTVVIAKAHTQIMSMLPQEVISKMFIIALNLGGGLIKKLGATGITYILNEGKGAGQKVPHASINIIPRYENDGFSISSPERAMDEKELNEYLENIVAKLQSSAEPEKKEPKPAEETKEKTKEKKEKPVIVVKERVPRYW